MNIETILNLIVSIIAGLATAIPLAVQLVKYVKAAIKEKNWDKLLELVMEYMETAESKFDNGTERKEWVLMMIKATADTIDYDIDLDAVSELIDSLCDMSKVVNGTTEEDADTAA